MINTVEIIKENIKRLMRLNDIKSAYALAKSCSIDTKTVNNLISKEHANPNINPTIKKIESYAKPFQVHPWMLLVQDFPFEIIEKSQLEKITPEGYVLLQAFEQASPDSRKQILNNLAYLMQENDHNKVQSKQLRKLINPTLS
jgi:hypothetical protein